MFLGLLFKQKHNVRESHSSSDGLLAIQNLPRGQIVLNFPFQSISERLQAFFMCCDTALGHTEPNECKGLPPSHMRSLELAASTYGLKMWKSSSSLAHKGGSHEQG
jgi:hypothetical protein